jgi:hypothetical protein
VKDCFGNRDRRSRTRASTNRYREKAPLFDRRKARTYLEMGIASSVRKTQCRAEIGFANSPIPLDFMC